MNKIDYKSAYENVLIANGMLRQQNKELHNKIDKAIEYILSGRYGEEDDYESISLYIPDLLKILKDSDVDE